MNSPSKLHLLLCFAIGPSVDAVEPVQTRRLDHRAVTTVPVSTNRVTTISFPGPISAIDAAGVSNDPTVPASFQLAHSKGTDFLSVRASAPRAAANLNVRWNRRTYVFELIESGQPLLSLQLEVPPKVEPPRSAESVTPIQLLALLDKAKVFPLLKAQHPEAVAGAEARTFGDAPQITDFFDCTIRINEVFRFDAEDTLVFHVTLKNRSDREIRYQPGGFSVRVGERMFFQSISDADGVLPANTGRTVYFAITGAPEGGRNELSLQNDFTVLFTRLTPPPAPPEAGQSVMSRPEEGEE